MTSATRIKYHTEIWPAACEAQGWNPKDQAKRQDVCLLCMELVHGPMVTTSHASFRDAEIDALFCYLRHLGDPDNISLSLEWDKCRADYRAYSTAKKADYWERRGFGRSGSSRLRENRFAGRSTAKGDALDDPLPQEDADQRLWKMRQRTRAREKYNKRPGPTPARKVTLDSDRKHAAGIPAKLIPF